MNQPASEPFLPLCEPSIHGNEWTYVKECLDTGWVSSVGRFVDEFEQRVAAKVGAPHAVAVVNGTAAIHISLVAVGVQPGDEVLCSDLTFIATANAIRHAGAHPVLVDAEPDHWQMDVQLLDDFVKRHCESVPAGLRNRETGRRIKAIVPVHVLGGAVDMAALNRWAERWNVAVVEDAAEGLGASYRGRSLGCWGQIGCYSFNGNKVITTGGGGVLVTECEKTAQQAKHLTTTAKQPGGEYIHTEVGYNYRLTNVLAAIGCAQMEQLDEHIAAKRRASQAYRERLAAIDGIHLWDAGTDVDATYWLHTIRVDAATFGASARDVMAHLADHGIQARPLWQPMHLSPAHQTCQSILTGVSADLYRDCLSIPSSVTLQEADIERVCRCIEDCGISNRRSAA